MLCAMNLSRLTPTESTGHKFIMGNVRQIGIDDAGQRFSWRAVLQTAHAELNKQNAGWAIAAIGVIKLITSFMVYVFLCT